MSFILLQLVRDKRSIVHLLCLTWYSFSGRCVQEHESQCELLSSWRHHLFTSPRTVNIPPKQHSYQWERPLSRSYSSCAKGRLLSLNMRISWQGWIPPGRDQSSPRASSSEQFRILPCEETCRCTEQVVQSRYNRSVADFLDHTGHIERNLDATSRLLSQLAFLDRMTASKYTWLELDASVHMFHSVLEDAHVIPALIHKCYLAKSAVLRCHSMSKYH